MCHYGNAWCPDQSDDTHECPPKPGAAVIDLGLCAGCGLEITNLKVTDKYGVERCVRCSNAHEQVRGKATLVAQQRGADLAAHIKGTAIAAARAMGGRF